MSQISPVLTPALQDLEDSISDFRKASFHSVVNGLSRLVHHLDEEPMAGFLRGALPTTDFAGWWKKADEKSALRVLEWPIERGHRVAMQIALCRAIVDGSVSHFHFIHHYYSTTSKLSDHVTTFASKFLDPLFRDISRLAESRQVPPILFAAMGKLPDSGDATLDQLLNDACVKFRDPAPAARAEATEKLWDAWERLKSLGISDNKRISVTRLLDRASKEPVFRKHLETEARGLTEIGNTFQIRHFEKNAIPISTPEMSDYLFHRLYALIHFLLFSRPIGDDDLS